MKFILSFLGLCLVALNLTSCGTKGGGGGIAEATTGPFDRNGNYVEAWADSPSKWKKSRFGSDSTPTAEETRDVPQVAATEQPPANAVPVSTTAPVEVASRRKSAVTSTKPTQTVKRTSRSEDDEERPSTAARAKTKSGSTTKAKSETVKAKPKTPAKAKTSRVLVKKGDSLSAIASRNGTSVGAIQRANGISGTLIRPGQSLVIPK